MCIGEVGMKGEQGRASSLTAAQTPLRGELASTRPKASHCLDSRSSSSSLTTDRRCRGLSSDHDIDPRPFLHVAQNKMAALSPPSRPMSPSLTRRSKSFARRCERGCCRTILYFPLVVIYALTTWAVWAETCIGFLPTATIWTGTAVQSLFPLL